METLNNKQLDAINSTEGRVRVVAGAGAGKTKVLSNRYVHLVEKLGIDPANILCMTFTNKAAQEMKKRIGSLLTVDIANDYICTIHSLCIKILRKEIFRIGFPNSFTILDDDDSEKMMKQVMQEMNITREENTVQKLLAHVAQEKRGIDYIECFLPGYDYGDELTEVDRFYQLQLKYYALDFSDIVNFAIYILRNFEEARNYWQKEFDYIQVDECQDCSETDWLLIDTLSEKCGNLFIVGDADQCIYEWRGAKPEYFVNFESDKDVILDQNYRSTQAILDVANCVIENNRNRIEKNMFTENGQGALPIYMHAKNEKEEVEFITSEIKNHIRNGRNENDFAILFRAANQSRAIEQELMKNKIPYTIYGGVRFFDRAEIKDAISYLKLIDNVNDDLAFKRVINMPSRKFGNVKLKELQTISNEENVSLYTALVHHRNDKKFNLRDINEFIDAIDECASKKNKIKISDLFNEILEKSNLTGLYRKDENEERLENINELMQSIKNYEEENIHEKITLTKYLQDISLYTNLDMKKDGGRVRLMTIHQSKGLEFPMVFILGMTEGVFPSHRTLRERKEEGLEEERRLFYVASTRAKEMLYMSECEGWSGISKSNRYPSRFLFEINANLRKLKGRLDPDLVKSAKAFIKRVDYDNEICIIEGTRFNESDTVMHDVFGKGIILSVNCERKSCEVLFGDKIKNIKNDYLTLCES